MSVGALYRRLAALSPEQRARFTRRLAADGLADPDAEIAPRPPAAAAPPASLMQQRLWLIDQMEPGSAFYNLPLLGFRLEGPLGPPEQAALAGACAEIERRHEALRTTFAAADGAPVQVIAPPARQASPLPLADLSRLPAPQAAAGALALAEARRPFDLARGPLWRTRLLRLGPADHLFLVTMHHIISDAWSIGVLYRELAALYSAFLRGLPSPLAALPVQYPDYALWQRRRFADGLLAEEIGFWRGQLAGAPELIALPTDRPRPRDRTYRGRRRIFAPPEGLPEALVGLAQASGASLFMVLLAGLDALLHRVTGQDDLVLGSPVAGRNHLGTESLIGFFVNTVVLRVRLTDDLTVRQLVARVREVVLDVYEHQELPFDRLVEELQPKRSTSHSPIFQTMFSLQNIATPDLALERLRVTPQWVDNGTAQTDLILFAGAQRGWLDTLQLEYNTDLFDDATIARMERHLLNVLAAAAAAPATRLGDLPLLTEGERLQLLEWSGALGAPLPADDLEPRLERRFARWAALAPHKVAVELGAESLTYGELDRRAERLAARLHRLGVGPEVRVGLCIRRTLDMPVAIVAVLKAGGAYLPLDPEAPPERLRMLLADAAAPVAVTTADLAGRLAAAPSRLVLLGGGEGETEGEGERGAPAADTCEGSADHLAYVLYTSGSTGRPKGVLISHRNVLRLFAATAAYYHFTAEDVWTIFHSFAFDFSMWELWGALLHGGRAVLLPATALRSPEELLAVLCTREVTLLSQTPAAFRGLAAAVAERPEAAAGLVLRGVMMAGEALLPEDLRPWFARFGDGGPLVANMFGPTEVTVHGTFRRMTPADLERTASPIGVPFADLSLHLLDGSGNPVPIGVPGEILVGGAGLARGYLGRPDLTAEQFVPDPFGAAPGGRLYRSGDLGRRLADGDVEYLGRIDHQVKVRGVRIELGEIEVALLRHPAVAAAAVALRELAPGETGLVAYWVPAAAGSERTSADLLVAPRKGSTAGDLRAFLRESLPEVMVPSAFVPLAALPLTVNGKLDRRALPAPERLRQADEGYAPPTTPLEATLVAVWRDLLGLDRIGVRDDFFELGGHSLLATRLTSRLRDRLDVDLSAQLVFQAPTIAAMAAELDRVMAAGAQAAAEGVVVPRAPALVPVARRARRSGAGG